MWIPCVNHFLHGSAPITPVTGKIFSYFDVFRLVGSFGRLFTNYPTSFYPC
jgi:hypothetical protein